MALSQTGLNSAPLVEIVKYDKTWSYLVSHNPQTDRFNPPYPNLMIVGHNPAYDHEQVEEKGEAEIRHLQENENLIGLNEDKKHLRLQFLNKTLEDHGYLELEEVLMACCLSPAKISSVDLANIPEIKSEPPGFITGQLTNQQSQETRETLRKSNVKDTRTKDRKGESANVMFNPHGMCTTDRETLDIRKLMKMEANEGYSLKSNRSKSSLHSGRDSTLDGKKSNKVPSFHLDPRTGPRESILKKGMPTPRGSEDGRKEGRPVNFSLGRKNSSSSSGGTSDIFKEQRRAHHFAEGRHLSLGQGSGNFNRRQSKSSDTSVVSILKRLNKKAIQLKMDQRDEGHVFRISFSNDVTENQSDRSPPRHLPLKMMTDHGFGHEEDSVRRREIDREEGSSFRKIWRIYHSTDQSMIGLTGNQDLGNEGIRIFKITGKENTDDERFTLIVHQNGEVCGYYQEKQDGKEIDSWHPVFDHTNAVVGFRVPHSEGYFGEGTQKDHSEAFLQALREKEMERVKEEGVMFHHLCNLVHTGKFDWEEDFPMQQCNFECNTYAPEHDPVNDSNDGFDYDW